MQHRGVVVANRGVVAASQPLAVSAGLNILQRGGTFADAAIATSAVPGWGSTAPASGPAGAA